VSNIAEVLDDEVSSVAALPGQASQLLLQAQLLAFANP
jgi:hypothetical protein